MISFVWLRGALTIITFLLLVTAPAGHLYAEDLSKEGLSTENIDAQLSSEQAATPINQATAEPWKPAVAFNLQRWDWIELTSGEWLKGTLRAMREDSIEFDSDKLDRLDIDWDDVASVYTGRVMSVLLNDGRIVLGKITTEKGQLVIGGGEPIPFNRILSVAIGSPREFDLWSADVSVGVNFRSGNVEQKELNTVVSVQRRTATSSARFNYQANYSEISSVKNVDNHRLNISDDFRISRKWFLRPVSFEYYRDPFQNRDSQWTLGFGAGYRIYETPKLDWSVAIGPGYQRTTFETVAAGEDRVVATPAVLFGTYYDQELTSAIDFEASYQVTATNTKAGRASHDFYSALDVDLTSRLDLRIAGTWTRIESPQPDEDNVTPEKDDFRLTIGLNLEI